MEPITVMRHLKDWDVSLDGIIAEKNKYWTFYSIYSNIVKYIFNLN